MPSFAQGLLKTAEVSTSKWVQQQIANFEAECRQRSSQGGKSIDTKTQDLPDPMKPKEVEDMLRQKLNGYGFKTASVNCGPFAYRNIYGKSERKFQIIASWEGVGDASPKASPQAGHQPQGGHAQACALKPLAFVSYVLRPR